MNKINLNILALFSLIIFSSNAIAFDATAITDNPSIEEVRKLSNNSLGILIMSGIGTVYSGMLYSGADSQEKEAKANVEKLDKLIKTFNDSYANFCPQGRENLTEPKCYCYLESGKKNPNRTNSQTCVALWAKDSYMITSNKGDYSNSSGFVDVAGCVNVNGQFDEKCNCKKFVDAKGGNACMKTTSINIPTELGANFATSFGLQQLTNFSNNAANGNPKLDLLNTAQLNANAINAKKTTQEMYSKIGPQLKGDLGNLLKVNPSNVHRLTASILGDKAMKAAMNGSGAISMAGSRETDAKTSALLQQAAKSAGLAEFSGGNGLGNKRDGKDSMKFNFLNEPSGNSNSQAQNFPEAEKNYNYRGNDISKKKEDSIFQIISNRYVLSGLKHLFDN